RADESGRVAGVDVDAHVLQRPEGLVARAAPIDDALFQGRSTLVVETERLRDVVDADDRFVHLQLLSETRLEATEDRPADEEHDDPGDPDECEVPEVPSDRRID